jgi:hypothetical protein
VHTASRGSSAECCGANGCGGMDEGWGEEARAEVK